MFVVYATHISKLRPLDKKQDDSLSYHISVINEYISSVQPAVNLYYYNMLNIVVYLSHLSSF